MNCCVPRPSHRLDDTQIPKQVFYGQLHYGSWRPGGQYRRYKDCLKSTLNSCGIAPSELKAMDTAKWRSSCNSAVEKSEIRRIQELESKRDLRKSGPPPTSNFECQICHRMCRSWIRLPTRDDETHRVDGSVHDRDQAHEYGRRPLCSPSTNPQQIWRSKLCCCRALFVEQFANKSAADL